MSGGHRFSDDRSGAETAYAAKRERFKQYAMIVRLIMGERWKKHMSFK